MTYKEFLEDIRPDREDVGFGVAALASVLAFMLTIGSLLCFAYGNFEPLLAVVYVFIGVVNISVIVFFVGTFTYWAIAERKD